MYVQHTLPFYLPPLTPPSQRQHGWRTAKRPGVDYFLAYLSQFYEIVIFTTQFHYVRLLIPILQLHLLTDGVALFADRHAGAR